MMAGNETTRYSYPAIPEIPQGDVEFGKEIGRGATSKVYKGIWKTKDNLPVAIKHIYRNVQEIEFIALKMINDDKENKHEIGKTFITHILGLITKPPLTCIVLEYAENGSLLEYLSQKRKQQQPLEHDKFFTWTRQGALAIKYLHEYGIIHRDIKSANFLITNKYNLKLCDFGISRLTGKTITTTLAGSIPWMAPECHDDNFSLNSEIEVSPRSDIYSYGVVIWEMWTCKEPEVSMKVNGMYPLVEETPPKLKDMLHSCWEVDRIKRPSIPDILQTIKDLSNTMGIEVKDFIEDTKTKSIPMQNIKPSNAEGESTTTVSWTSANTGLTDFEYRQLVVEVSSWWKKHGNVNKLKVIIGQFKSQLDLSEIEKNTDPYKLFALLRVPGIIGPSNVDVLIEAVVIGEMGGLDEKLTRIKKWLPTFPGFHKISIPKYWDHRRKLIQLCRELGTEDIVRIGQLYEMDEEDKWMLIFKLDSQGKFPGENLTEFFQLLKE